MQVWLAPTWGMRQVYAGSVSIGLAKGSSTIDLPLWGTLVGGGQTVNLKEIPASLQATEV